MKINKQKEFNSKMGKAKHYPRHQNLSKGGMVDKRKHFADGGTTVAAPSDTTSLNANTQNGGLFGALTDQSGYTAQLAPTTQLNYTPTIGAASNYALNSGAVNDAIAAEHGLVGQYGDIAAGRGPNPAQASLNQATAQNVANTAALQAGQRGSAGNVGLIARQIGQTGAATQQNAVGQSATLQANQQLGALGAQAGLQNQIATQGLGEQGVGANVYATGAGANNTQNATNVANYGQAQGTNAATAAANSQATQQTSGGILGGIGSLLSLSKGGEVEKFDNGGGVLGVNTQMPGAPIIPNSGPSLGVAPLPGAQIAAQPSGPTLGVDTSMPNPNNSTIAQGTLAPAPTAAQAPSQRSAGDDPTGWKSLIGGIGGSGVKDEVKSVMGSGGSGGGGGGGGIMSLAALLAKGGEVHPGPHKSHVANYLADGGSTTSKVPALVSAKEVYLNPHQVQEVVERGADPMKIGHHFPGVDKVKKNSQKNDVIPTELEDGGVVLPISVTTHKNASEKGRKFVEKAHAKRYLKKPKGI